jgi:hypothetical protein
VVISEPAENPERELADSLISKLWIQRIVDRKMVFNWDRRADVEATDATVQAIVAFLAAGLAEYVFAE